MKINKVVKALLTEADRLQESSKEVGFVGDVTANRRAKAQGFRQAAEFVANLEDDK